MNRPVPLLVIGAFMLFVALTLPQHLSTTDTAVLEYAGEDTEGIHQVADGYLDRGSTGPVEIIKNFGDAMVIDNRLRKLYHGYPEYRVSGGPSPYFSQYLKLINYPSAREGKKVSLMKVVIPRDHREKLYSMLESSSVLSVQSILKTRELTNVNRFMPVYTAAGGPLESSILVTALLLQGNYLSESVQIELKILADSAMAGDIRAVDRLEQYYLSVLGMGFRLNWMQFVTWARYCLSVDDFVRSVSVIHAWPDRLPLLYTASVMVEDFGAVSRYVERFKTEETLNDLSEVVAYGSGAVSYLIEMNQPVYHGRGWMSALDGYRYLSFFCYYLPTVSLIFKLASLFLSTWCFITGILLLSSWHKDIDEGGEEGHPTLRNVLLSLLFGILLLALVEPGHSSTDGPKADTASIHVNIANIVNDINRENMNNITTDLTTIMVLILFFVLQLVIYFIGLKKITQIREEKESADLKLKLLDNEENLFDCGLYVGLGGTVASLILLAMDVVSASLVAAYASTLFGIIFVAVLKIFHVRPYKRLLIVECKKNG